MASTPGPASQIDLGGNVADLVTAAAHRGQQHPAFIDTVAGEQLTWGEVATAVDGEARRLSDAGVAAGDRVLIRLPGGAAFAVALLAALRIGAVAVPVGTGAAGREVEQIMKACEPRLAVSSGVDEVITRAAAAADAAVLDPPGLTGVSVAPDGAPSAGGGEDIAVLSFTSGTTGVPRGVRLSHRALLANRAQTGALRPAPVTPADSVLLTLPLFHVFGLGAGLLQVCWAGATGVLVDRFDPAATVELSRRHRVSVVAAVPAMYRAWLDLPADVLRAGFASVRLFTAGGAPLPPQLLSQFRAATGLDVFEGYGLTETGPVLTTNQVSGVAKPASVGRPLPGAPGVSPVELRLVDTTGRPLAQVLGGSAEVFDARLDDGHEPDDHDPEADELDEPEDLGQDTGLVAVRGPNLFSGYWPDGTGGPDEHGWFRTGDVGFFDADGDLHLVDRTSDLVIVNGFNVYPREVEQVLVEHPAVADAAVVGIPDDRTGEAVKAVVVRRGGADGAELTHEAVREFCTERLARFKVPTVVQFVEGLPRSEIGKVARRSLRDSG